MAHSDWQEESSDGKIGFEPTSDQSSSADRRSQLQGSGQGR